MGTMYQFLLDGTYVAEIVSAVFKEFNAKNPTLLPLVGANKNCEAIAKAVNDVGANRADSPLSTRPAQMERFVVPFKEQHVPVFLD